MLLAAVVGCLSWGFITLNVFIAKYRRQYYKHLKWALLLEVVLMTVANSLLQMWLPSFGTCIECSSSANPGICGNAGAREGAGEGVGEGERMREGLDEGLRHVERMEHGCGGGKW